MKFKTYLTEAAFKVTSHNKKKDGRTLHHTVEIESKKKIDFDEVASKVGYPPMAYGASKSKISDIDGGFRYEWDSAASAGG